MGADGEVLPDDARVGLELIFIVLHSFVLCIEALVRIVTLKDFRMH